MICFACLGERGHGSIVDGWTPCEKCDGTGERPDPPISPLRPGYFYSVAVDWSSEESLHVFLCVCERCDSSETFKVGKNYNRPTGAMVNWMINHRTGDCRRG